MSKPPRTREPKTLHALPVFCRPTGEAGWLLYTGRRTAKSAKFFEATLEDASWEPPVKAWFVPHDLLQGALAGVALAHAPADVALCQDCAAGGEDPADAPPCERWPEDLDELDFVVRTPTSLAYQDAAAFAEEQRRRRREGLREAAQAVADATMDPEHQRYWQELFAGLQDTVRAVQRRWGKRFFPHGHPASGPVSGQGGAPKAGEATRELREAAAALGLAWPCERAAVTLAYRRAAMAAHPDRGGSDEAMARVNRARDLLVDATS